MIEKKKEPISIGETLSSALKKQGLVIDVEMAKDWLWRFYGLRISVCYGDRDKSGFMAIVFVNRRLGKSRHPDRIFDTHDEATLDGIQYALELINDQNPYLNKTER